MRIGLGIAALAATAFIAVTPVQAATTYFVFTGQSNAQTQIEVNHTSSWNFVTGGSGFDLGGGNFTLKEGPNVIENITLSLYTGSSAIFGNLVTQLNLTNSQFDALFAPPITVPIQNTQSFTLVPLHFSTPVTLLANSQYHLALTSLAPDQQSVAYFIKGFDSFTITDTGGGTPPDVVLETPEPASMLLLAVGLAGLGVIRRRTARGTAAAA